MQLVQLSLDDELEAPRRQARLDSLDRQLQALWVNERLVTRSFRACQPENREAYLRFALHHHAMAGSAQDRWTQVLQNLTNARVEANHITLDRIRKYPPKPVDIDDALDAWEPDLDQLPTQLHIARDLDLEDPDYWHDVMNPELEDRWQRRYVNGVEHLASFQDLLDDMAIVGNESQSWAERISRYAWNDDYFQANRVPMNKRVGRVDTGRFVFWPDGTSFAACVCKRVGLDTTVRADGEQVLANVTAEFIVLWRENLGEEVVTTDWGKTRKVRRWQFLYAKRFTDRADALGFANRLTTLARNESDLAKDDTEAWKGAQQTPTWWEHEMPFEPEALLRLERPE